MRVVMMGASGAVGSEAVAALCEAPSLVRLTLLNRRDQVWPSHPGLRSWVGDVLEVRAYADQLAGHGTAVCTLGVGQPSRVDPATFRRVDLEAVLAFAQACRVAGVQHFVLLSSIEADPQSRNRYLRTKGELEAGLMGLEFARLSLFQPSMILTPQNRYGWTQGLMLAVWPRLHGLMRGGWTRFRGVMVRTLGRAIARQAVTPTGPALWRLQWSEMQALGA